MHKDGIGSSLGYWLLLLIFWIAFLSYGILIGSERDAVSMRKKVSEM